MGKKTSKGGAATAERRCSRKVVTRGEDWESPESGEEVVEVGR